MRQIPENGDIAHDPGGDNCIIAADSDVEYGVVRITRSVKKKYWTRNNAAPWHPSQLLATGVINQGYNNPRETVTI
jgi:hypothetical protein